MPTPDTPNTAKMSKMFYDLNTMEDDIMPPTVTPDGDLSATLRSLASRLRFDRWDRCFSDACLSAAAIIEAKQGGMLTQLANRSYTALADALDAAPPLPVPDLVRELQEARRYGASADAVIADLRKQLAALGYHPIDQLAPADD